MGKSFLTIMPVDFYDPIEDIEESQDELLVREIEKTIEQNGEEINDDHSWIHAAEIVFSKIRKLGLNINKP